MKHLLERKISRETRKKMARSAKRTQKKRMIARKRKEKRRKNPAQLKQIAQKQAKNFIVKKMTGGKNYSDLPITAKEKIEKQLAKKPGLVARVAKKMLPRVKAKEKERIKKIRAKNKPTEKPQVDEAVDPLTIASVIAITGGAVAITATLAKKLHGVFFSRSVDFDVKKTYELIKKKYPGIFSDIAHQRFGRGKLAKFFSDIEDEIPGLKKKSFMNNITSIIDQLMKYHNWSTIGDQSGKLDPERFQRESVTESEDYKTANEIKKQWKKEYPNDKFTFKKVRAKGNEWLLVLSPKGVELERYQHVPKTGWIKMNENTEQKEDLKDLKGLLDIAKTLSDKSPYFKGRGSKKEYIKMLVRKIQKLSEAKKQKLLTRMDAYKKVRKPTVPKSRPMKSKKAYDRKDYKKGKYD